MIKKHLYSLYNFKKFVKTIKHNYKNILDWMPLIYTT